MLSPSSKRALLPRQEVEERLPWTYVNVASSRNCSGRAGARGAADDAKSSIRARGKKTGVRRRRRTPPTGSEVESVLGGLPRQTGVLVGRGENLTRRVGTLMLTTAEELPSSRCFCAVGDIFFSAGSRELAILASQSHAQVKSPCDCVAKTLTLPQQWGNNNIAGVNFR